MFLCYTQSIKQSKCQGGTIMKNMNNDILGMLLSGEYTGSQTTSTTATTTKRENSSRRLSHAERMAQIEKDYEAERAQIMAEHRKRMEELQRESDRVDRIQAECEELNRMARAALAAGKYDEFHRLSNEAFNKVMSLRH